MTTTVLDTVLRLQEQILQNPYEEYERIGLAITGLKLQVFPSIDVASAYTSCDPIRLYSHVRKYFTLEELWVLARRDSGWRLFLDEVESVGGGQNTKRSSSDFLWKGLFLREPSSRVSGPLVLHRKRTRRLSQKNANPKRIYKIPTTTPTDIKLLYYIFEVAIGFATIVNQNIFHS